MDTEFPQEAANVTTISVTLLAVYNFRNIQAMLKNIKCLNIYLAIHIYTNELNKLNQSILI